MLSLIEANAHYSESHCLTNKPEQTSLLALADDKTRVELEYFALKLIKLQLRVPKSTGRC